MRIRSIWSKTQPVKPAFIGIKSFDSYSLEELAQYIDWTPFFQTWELTGRFPAILDDPKVGEAARSLYADARKMLDRIVKENWFKARATIGFWPANAEGDDIVLYSDEARLKPLTTLHTLRQQLEKREGRKKRRAVGLHRARQQRCAGLHRHVRGDGGHRRGRDRGPASKTPMTTTHPFW